MDEYWNKCDECGRFISFGDFDDKEHGAIRKYLYNEYETYLTLCKHHADELRRKIAQAQATPPRA